MTFIIFFIIISLLILSHELGHFLVAKKTDTKVEEFGFGFPPKIFSFKRGETVYSLNLFPIGGFVKILGEDGLKENAQDPETRRNFSFKPAWVKVLILSAGVIFNLILAWILLSLSMGLGSLKQIEDSEISPDGNPQVIITEIMPESPAEISGIMAGDVILKMSSGGSELSVTKISEVQEFINKNKGSGVKILLKRGGDEISVDSQIREMEAEKGALGVAMARVAIIKEPWYLAIFNGFKDTIILTFATAVAILAFIAGLFRGVGLDQVAGPVGIFNIVGQASNFGFAYVAQLAAILSINLAIINFLPFPALDGGRLLFVIIEKIKGSPLNQKAVNMANIAGFVILLVLMALVTYRDILKLI